MSNRAIVRRLVAVGALVGALALVPPSAASAADDTTCSKGDATALLETMPQAFSVQLRHDQPRFGETVANCQYRLFWDGRTITFSEDDTFLGGIVLMWDYPAVGMTRAEAIADLENFDVRSYLAKVDRRRPGQLSALTLSETGYKDSHHELFGKIVWKQWGHVTQLAAGRYVNVTELYFGGELVETWRVNLEVTAA